MAPKIDRRNLNPVTVKAGQAFSFDVKVKGEPAPTVRWKLKDKAVEERSDLSITNIPYNTKLVCDKSQRIDAGIYRIIASNAHGEDNAEVEVFVLGKLRTYCRVNKENIFSCLNLFSLYQYLELIFFFFL